MGTHTSTQSHPSGKRRPYRTRTAAVFTIGAIFAAVKSAPGAYALATDVPLGRAGSYLVLAGSTVADTGPTVVNGDLGVAPGSAVTGFPPGQVIAPGTINAANAAALGAQEDLHQRLQRRRGPALGRRDAGRARRHDARSGRLHRDDGRLDRDGHAGCGRRPDRGVGLPDR